MILLSGAITSFGLRPKGRLKSAFPGGGVRPASLFGYRGWSERVSQRALTPVLLALGSFHRPSPSAGRGAFGTLVERGIA